MIAFLTKSIYLFLTNLVMALFGEQMIKYLFFKVARFFTSKTKTKKDDEFIDKLEQEYDKRK